MKNNLKTKIIEKSRELGLTDIRFTNSSVDDVTIEHLKQWIELGYSANMKYIPNNIDKRNNPQLIWKCSINYCSILILLPGQPLHNPS